MYLVKVLKYSQIFQIQLIFLDAILLLQAIPVTNENIVEFVLQTGGKYYVMGSGDGIEVCVCMGMK